MILFEDEWVAKIVAKFPNHSKAEAKGANKEAPAIEVEIDPKKRAETEDQNADTVRKEKDTNGPGLVTKDVIGNIQSDLETV